MKYSTIKKSYHYICIWCWKTSPFQYLPRNLLQLLVKEENVIKISKISSAIIYLLMFSQYLDHFCPSFEIFLPFFPSPLPPPEFTNLSPPFSLFQYTRIFEQHVFVFGLVKDEILFLLSICLLIFINDTIDDLLPWWWCDLHMRIRG